MASSNQDLDELFSTCVSADAVKISARLFSHKQIARNAFAVVVAGSLAVGSMPAFAATEGLQSSPESASSSAPVAPSAPADAPEPPDGSAGVHGAEGGPDGAPDGVPGGAPGGMPGDAPGGMPDGVPGGAPGGMGGPGGANTQAFDYSGTYSGACAADGETKSVSSSTIEATDSDQNAVLSQNGGNVKLSNVTLTKSGDDSDGDRCNFYGANSIALAVGEDSLLMIEHSALFATSEGSNGVFSTDSANVYANNDSIKTTADNSRGLDATYGGTIVADKLSVETEGDHCAGIATDRGGGNVSCSNSSFTTSGSGSPVLYSTGGIEVDNIEGVATGSQLVGIEGYNHVYISNSTLTSTITQKTASDPMADGVIIYQSMSGDADTSTGQTARFQAKDSTLSSAIESGSMFYSTNTTAQIVLSNVSLDFDSSKAKLLCVQGNNSNGWGTAGKNGSHVTFTGFGQSLEGDIEVDTISSANIFLLDGSTYKGSCSVVQNADGANTVDEPLIVNVSKDSTWVVTEDSALSNLNVEQGGRVVDASGNTATIVANGEVVVKGEGSVTVTVNGSLGETFETSDANEISDPSIDRSGFDAQFGLTTTFGQNSEAIGCDESVGAGGGFLASIASWWSSFIKSLGI